MKNKKVAKMIAIAKCRCGASRNKPPGDGKNDIEKKTETLVFDKPKAPLRPGIKFSGLANALLFGNVQDCLSYDT